MFYCIKDQTEFLSHLFSSEVKTKERVTKERETEKGKMKENDQIDTDNRPIEIEETGIWSLRLSTMQGLDYEWKYGWFYKVMFKIISIHFFLFLDNPFPFYLLFCDYPFSQYTSLNMALSRPHWYLILEIFYWKNFSFFSFYIIPPSPLMIESQTTKHVWLNFKLSITEFITSSLRCLIYNVYFLKIVLNKFKNLIYTYISFS